MAVVWCIFGAAVEHTMVGFVGMSETKNIGMRIFKNTQQTFFVPVFKQIFIDFARTAVYQQELHVFRRLHFQFKPDVFWHLAQV